MPYAWLSQPRVYLWLQSALGADRPRTVSMDEVAPGRFDASLLLADPRAGHA
jgi:hypothetical protein